ncbi:MAG TPA: hypothetical protein VNL70_05290 [Tepidisphaeraceae bacterium]|nr:hypothetical protein [Tepidisphaeraceae bacterium]
MKTCSRCGAGLSLGASLLIWLLGGSASAQEQQQPGAEMAQAAAHGDTVEAPIAADAGADDSADGSPATAAAKNNPSTRPAPTTQELEQLSSLLWPDGRGGYRALSSEERYEFLEFAEQHMPNMLNEAINSSDFRRLALRRLMMMRWRGVSRIRDDSALYDRMVRNIEMEDAIFAQVQSLEAASPQKRREIRQRVRAQVREMVEQFLEERAQRLERLRGILAREQQRLEEDRQNKEKLIEERTERLLREMSLRELPPGGPPGMFRRDRDRDRDRRDRADDQPPTDRDDGGIDPAAGAQQP